MRKIVAFLMQGDALALSADALALLADALALLADALVLLADALVLLADALALLADALILQGIIKFNSLRINEMLYFAIAENNLLPASTRDAQLCSPKNGYGSNR